MTVVDASVWVAYFIITDAHHMVSNRWLREQLHVYDELVAAPTLLLPEVGGAIARRSGNTVLGQDAVLEMRQLPELKLVPIDEKLASEAASLATTLRLRGADAVYVATAQALSVPLITWDEELAERAKPVVEVRQPR